MPPHSPLRALSLRGLLLSALLLAACGPSHVKPPVDGPATAAELMARAALARGSLTALSAEARVEYYGKHGVRKGDMVVVAERPGRVRFEALSPSGDTLAVLVSDGSRFTSFQRGQRECHTGPACPRNVGRLLPIALPPTAVVAVLLGEAPQLPHRTESLRFDSESGRYELTLADPESGILQRIEYEPTDLAVRKVTVFRDEHLLFRIAYDRLQKVGDLRLPRRVSFRMPMGDVDLSLAYRDWERDPADLDPSLFHFDCPEGTRRLTLPCDDPPPPPREGARPDAE